MQTGMKSPWSWQQPPLPPSYSISGQHPTRNERVWHRRPWGPEATFAASSLVSPGYADIIISCHLNSPHRAIDVSHVKSAVRLLRYDHPAIAARFAYTNSAPPSPSDVRLAYEVPASEREVDAWLDEVVIVRADALHEAGGDVGAAVARVTHDLGKAAAGPPTTLFEADFIPGPQSALVLRLGHAIFDGIGAFQVLDLLNERIARVLRGSTDEPLAWGEEVARLAVPTPECVTIPWAPGEDTVVEDRVMLDRLVEAINMKKTLQGVPFSHPSGSGPICTGVITRTLPPESVQALLSAARAHGCTLFSLFLAAMLLALQRTTPPSPASKLDTAISPSLADLRASCIRPNPNDRTQRRVANSTACQVYFARGLCGDTDVWALAKDLHAQVEGQRKAMGRAAFWVDEFMRVWGAAQGVWPSSIPPLPVLSSMGVVDPHLSPRHAIAADESEYLTISKPHLSVRTPTLAMHPYTWGGTLYIPFSFTEGLYGSAEEQREGTPLHRFIDAFMDVLQSAVDCGA